MEIEFLLLRHTAAKQMLACGNSKYWELVKAGEIEVVGKGGMSRATYASIKRYVAKLIDEARGKAA
jgi:hypothetical protein